MYRPARQRLRHRPADSGRDQARRGNRPVADLGNAGNDTLSAARSVSAIALFWTARRQRRLTGGASADVFLGGDGNDTVDGNAGNDAALLGAGDDLFIWNNGDGNDAIEGQDGSDALIFTGSNADEQIEVSANGARVRFFRDIGAVTMDLNDLERIGFNALGGADRIVVNDLTGTDVTRVRTNLFAGPGLGADGKQDSIVVNGTNGPDSISVSSVNGEVIVSELSAEVRFFGLDAGLDQLTVNGLGGLDLIDASGLAANLTKLTMNGGLDRDIFIGSSGNDSVVGGDGDDTAFLGAGNDTFTWNPGDDNDVIEGQTGSDLMLFNGAAVAENITISPNGGRMLFFRDIAPWRGHRRSRTHPLQRPRRRDRIEINDLAGTDVTDVESTSRDYRRDDRRHRDDVVVVNGTAGNDAITAATKRRDARLGLAARVTSTTPRSPTTRCRSKLAGNDDRRDAARARDDPIPRRRRFGK